MLSSLIDPQHPARMCTPMQLDSSFSCKIENFQSPCEQILNGYATIRLRNHKVTRPCLPSCKQSNAEGKILRKSLSMTNFRSPLCKRAFLK